MLIGHTHWDHIQGFPFFEPLFQAGAEIHIFATPGFQRSLEDSLAGQMQHSYFSVGMCDLPSQIHYTELEEGTFRVGEVQVETPYLNHTAPTIGFRLSDSRTTIAYVTDHEPFWNVSGPKFLHPGDQRHIAFMKNADLIIHDAQYSAEEYKTKHGWGHSPVEYVTDVAVAASARRLILFHHDPAHDDLTIKRLKKTASDRAAASGSSIEIFAAAEGFKLDVHGKGSAAGTTKPSHMESRPIEGRRILVLAANSTDAGSIEKALSQDRLQIAHAADANAGLKIVTDVDPDMIVMSPDADMPDIGGLRKASNRRDLPVLQLTRDSDHTFEAGDGGATDYLTLPFSPAMLRTRVRAWLMRTMESPRIESEAPRAVERFEPASLPDVRLSQSRAGQIVRSSTVFRSLTSAELAQLLDVSTEEDYEPDHAIVRQSEKADFVYVVLSGSVRVVQTSADAPAGTVLAHLGPGDIFGELGVLRGRPRNATVAAIEPTRCLKIPGPTFINFVDASHKISMALLRILADRTS